MCYISYFIEKLFTYITQFHCVSSIKLFQIYLSKVLCFFFKKYEKWSTNGKLQQKVEEITLTSDIRSLKNELITQVETAVLRAWQLEPFYIY